MDGRETPLRPQHYTESYRQGGQLGAGEEVFPREEHTNWLSSVKMSFPENRHTHYMEQVLLGKIYLYTYI